MLRKILELDLCPMTDSEFREVLDLATSDIKTNRVDFCKKTNLCEVVKIAKLCFRAQQKGKEAHQQKAGHKMRREKSMDNSLGDYKVTDRGTWFVEAKERRGITYMHAFAVGVITAIINDRYFTPEEIALEIRGTLSDLEKVLNDGSLSDGYRHEKALRANGEPKIKLATYSVP